MSNLITIEPNDELLFNDLLNNEIIVYEDVQGSKLYINYDGEIFNYKPSKMSSDNLNMIDLALQKYYNKAIQFCETLSQHQKAFMNKNWWFCFEYFPDNQPAHIEYDTLPKNNMVLTGIVKNNKFNYNVDELLEFSNVLGCDTLPFIFMGKLSEEQVKVIKYFLSVSEQDLEYIFDDKNFAYFFYKILNPSSNSSYLMDKNKFNDNIQKIIIKFKDKKIGFEILNPLYSKVSNVNTTEYIDVYSLIILNFINYIQLINLDSIKLEGKTKEDLYINMISKLFNLYMNDSKSDLDNFDIIIPEFFNKDKFKINKDLIQNKVTLDLIENPKYEYIFKVLLGSMNKKIKKEVGLIMGGGINLVNSVIDKLNKKIDSYMNIGSEDDLLGKNLLDFSDFYQIKYDVDADGEVYPELYKEFDNEDNFNNDKKGKGIKK